MGRQSCTWLLFHYIRHYSRKIHNDKAKATLNIYYRFINNKISSINQMCVVLNDRLCNNSF